MDGLIGIGMIASHFKGLLEQPAEIMDDSVVNDVSHLDVQSTLKAVKLGGQP